MALSLAPRSEHRRPRRPRRRARPFSLDLHVREALDRCQSSYLSKCFEESPNLRGLLYYDKGAGVLSIRDPRLAFYLRNTPWPTFIKRCGYAKRARIDAKGKLAFTPDRPL